MTKTAHSVTKAEEPKEEKVRLGLYLHWIKTELDNESACLELPFTIILLLSFSILAYLHLKQADVFIVEGAVRFDIEQNANFAWAINFGHKTVYDVNSFGDFWSWFGIGFLPLMVQHSWGYSESMQAGYDATMPDGMAAPFDSSTLPGSWGMNDTSHFGGLPVRDDYLHYNRIIGGIRMRQERAAIGWDLCRMPPNVPEDIWKSWLGKPCTTKNPNYELPPQVTQAETFAEPARVEWLMTALDSVREIQRKVVDMEDGCSDMADKLNTAGPEEAPNGGDGITCGCKTCSEGTGVLGPWLDEQTERIEIGLILYNFQYGLYSYVTTNMFFNRGGHIHKLVHVQSSWANAFTGTLAEIVIMLICDIIWILALTYILVQEVKEVIRVVQFSQERWYKSLKNEYLSMWNIVDWISIFVAYSVVVSWIRVYISTAVVNEDFQRIASINLASVNSTEARGAYEGDIATFFESVEGMVETEQLYRLSFMFYPMVVLLRLFKSFDAQPRLAVVTRTLVQASSDMVHFFIIFFSCYFCLSINAVLLFGKDFVAFASMSRSVITCFRGLFGDWEYKKMREVGLLACALWFWSFMLLLFMLLLNMLLAIVMEAYGDVKSTTEGLTLPKQVSEMVRRYRQTRRGDRVRLNDIWDAFFKTIGDEKDMVVWEAGPGFPEGQGGREFVTPELIQERVMTSMKLQVPMNQAKRGISQAKAVQEAKKAMPYTIKNVHQDFDRLNLLTRDVRDNVWQAVDILSQYDFDESDPEFQTQISENPEDITEHRQLVAEAVKGAVMQLTAEISTTLTKEAGMYERRQKQLEISQAEMVACAKDACYDLVQLRERTDEVVNRLQHLALGKQRKDGGVSAASNIASVVMGDLTGGKSSSSGFSACSNLEKGKTSSV